MNGGKENQNCKSRCEWSDKRPWVGDESQTKACRRG